MMIKAKKYFNKLSFRRKIFVSLLVGSIIPLLFLTVYVSILAYTLSQTNRQDVLKDNIYQLEQNIDEKITVTNQSMNALMFNEKLKLFFQDKDNSIYDLYAAFKETFDPTISNILSLNYLIKNVYFISDNHSLTVRSNIFDFCDNSELPLRIKYYDLEMEPTWLIDRDKIYVVSTFPYTDKDTHTIIFFEINKEKFLDDLVTDHNVYGLSLRDIDGNSLTYDHLQGFTSKTEDQGLKLVNDWQLTITYDNHAFVSYSSRIFLATALIITLIILIGLGISRYLARTLTKTIGDVNKKLQIATANNYENIFHSVETDEFGQLVNQIGQMMEQVKQLMSEIYQSTIEKQKSEYKALTNQINSHFLYNTLSALNWHLLLSGDEELGQAVQDLSTYYRTTLNNGHSHLQLTKELTNVRSYIKLQLFMKPNSFQVKWEIDDSLLQVEVINLLLQPIVENAIEHGFHQQCPNPTITIKIQKVSQKDFTIIISDNGCGIPKETIDSLFTNHESSGYGLKNIQKRIHFYFGSTYGITIRSQSGLGTTVQILLPITEITTK